MKNKIVVLVVLFSVSIGMQAQSIIEEKVRINAALDGWHRAAATANFDAYFNLMTSDAIFIGTDATENWNKESFKAYAKPHFDRGKAWNFTAMERHVFLNETATLAWFDELLDTQMKICRGSGVLVKVGNQWFIQQYVLSMTVPNEKSNEVITLKAPIEDPLILKYGFNK